MQNTKSFQVRVPQALHRRVKATAAADGKTVKAFVIEAFEAALKRPSNGKTNTAVPTTEQATA
jgi:predicted HicB family RNase H-like nuclease